MPLDVHFWSILPFALMLLAIALFPLFAGHFWESNLRKAMVALAIAVPVVLYLLYLEHTESQPGLEKLHHALLEYFSFIMLLFSLYTVAGGILIEGDFRPTPAVNAGFLAFGAVLANVIGTTGASMVLIRPVLRINSTRRYHHHIPVFFIFIVSNLGGVLTPLGDPPLFLGYGRGVDFFWTLQLWPQWLLANGLVLGVFLIWDAFAWRRDDTFVAVAAPAPLRVRGRVNLLFLAGVLAGVFLQEEGLHAQTTAWIQQYADVPDLPWGTLVMALMAGLSLAFTRAGVRKSNEFAWGAIIEVAVLFAGIFITMVPALEYLKMHRDELGLHHAWQYFWYTGALSSFLDNAPTYLTFGTIAAGHDHLGDLMRTAPVILQAISCGAVFMGANSYIGNGPNFMVKAMADASGYRMPSFFGYMLYSSLILLPIFAVVTVVFFPA